jgi:signal transduction histidine kinase
MAARTRHLEDVVAAATGQLVRQRDELEELARQQKEIMAVLAHDIRNPLSGIALTAEVLEEDLDAPEAKDGLRRIRSAVASVTEQLQQFLSLQAMESGVVALKMEPVPVWPLLEDVSNTLAAHADRKGQCIHLEGSDLQVLADGEVLREVLANLASNALKFSPWHSRVVIRTRRVAPAQGRIEVEDQGPGITDQDQEKLFTRFAKLSARPTGGEPSIGLGLAICKRMVESMNGRIGVESSPGCGSTFWVELAASGTESAD